MLASFFAPAANACSRQKELNSRTKVRTTSCLIPGYVIKKNPSHGATHGPTMLHCMCHKAHDMLKKAHKKQCSAILEQWYKDDLYRGSLFLIGWNEETILEYDKIASEDHSYTATREERRRNENSWKLSLNAEGANGPMVQRDAFEDAKERCERPYHERTAITGCGNTPIPPQQQVRQRPNQQFEGHGEYSKRLDSSGWKYYVPATMHSSIFVITMATEQLVVDVSTWNRDSWDSSSWSGQFFKVPDEIHFALPEI